LALLATIDPYTGRYFSQSWIQRNVLRLNDDDIKERQIEMDEEKEAGLGLPVGVTNDVASAQMMSQVPAQPQHPLDQEHEAELAQQAAAKSSVKEETNTLVKLKRIL